MSLQQLKTRSGASPHVSILFLWCFCSGLSSGVPQNARVLRGTWRVQVRRKQVGNGPDPLASQQARTFFSWTQARSLSHLSGLPGPAWRLAGILLIKG